MVYKYATGLAAAIALSQKVLNGGPDDLAAYLAFLRGGSSRIRSTCSAPPAWTWPPRSRWTRRLKHFGKLVDELDGLLK